MKPTEKSKALCQAMASVLQEKRLAAELSLTKMAELSGLTRQMVGFVEKGTRVPSLDTLTRLAIALDAAPSSLLREAERRSRLL